VSSENDNDDKKDITRIEQMPQFEHDEDLQLPNLPDLDDTENNINDDLILPVLPDLHDAPNNDIEIDFNSDQESFNIENLSEDINLQSNQEQVNDSFIHPEESTIATTQTVLKNDIDAALEFTQNEDLTTTPPPEISKPNIFESQNEQQVYSDTAFDTPAALVTEIAEAKESFADVVAFAENLTYGKVTKGGNPPFSILLKKIKFKEDKQDIETILREHELLNNENEKLYLQSLENGSLLLSQISEYSAIYLTQKFRRFDLEIIMGLSDEIHPSKSYDHDFLGLVNKDHVFQNRSQSLEINSHLQVHQIILSTQPTLPQFQILKYLGLISEHQIIDEEAVIKADEVDNQINQGALEEIFQDLSTIKKDIKKTLPENKTTPLSQIYQSIAERLRIQAIKLSANAVVGIIYQLTALPLKAGDDNQKYKVSCTGNAVVVSQSNQKNNVPNFS
jgi:uncharacterized protein YbjQ (UPF0145 family)